MENRIIGDKDRKKFIIFIATLLALGFLATIFMISFSFISAIYFLMFPKNYRWEEQQLSEESHILNYTGDINFKERELNISTGEELGPLLPGIFDPLIEIFTSIAPSPIPKENMKRILKSRFGMEREEYKMTQLKVTSYANMPGSYFMIKASHKLGNFKVAYYSMAPCDLNTRGCEEKLYFITPSRKLAEKVAISLCGYVDSYKKGKGRECIEEFLYSDGEEYAICFTFEKTNNIYTLRENNCSGLKG